LGDARHEWPRHLPRNPQQSLRPPYRYLIVITTREGEEGIAEAMASGADDFVCKPFGIPEVVARILHRASVSGCLTV
jgi:DNA-binding response OmpR family regulator